MFSALSFSAPLILTALLTLPAVWFLLRATPPTPKQVRFPAFVILRRLVSKDEKPEHTPWPLLLLRLLLTALIILGLAGPVLNAPPPATGNGPIVLVIDNSFVAAPQWQARVDAIKSAAAEAAARDAQIFIIPTAPQRIAQPLTPLTGEEARSRADTLRPQPFGADRAATSETYIADLEAFITSNGLAEPDIRWLSDGAASADDQTFADALRNLGPVSLYDDDNAEKLILRPIGEGEEGPIYQVERLNKIGDWEGALVATARDGRELSRIDLAINDDETISEAVISLPLALRNELASVRIENGGSAGAVQLADARDRRAFIGLISEAEGKPSNLLSGGHYLRQALGPYAEFIEGGFDEIIGSDVSVIILDDIGAIRAGDIDALNAWVERGGVLIRFAGPVLAEAAQDRTPALLPVELRGGGRAFGGALTWDTPQRLDAFQDDSPFAGLAAPEDVLIRRQVLAQPGGETSARSWARLGDGTPLVTGLSKGAGVIALFHVTATPDWSDLPISGVFIDMLRRLTFLSELGPEQTDENAAARYAPLRLMDGFGRMTRPQDQAPALTAEDILDPAGPERAPGFYGSPEASLALNVIRTDTPYAPLNVSGVRTLPFTAAPPVQIAPPLFAVALLLLLIDALATLALAGKLPLRQSATAATLIGAVFLSIALTPGAYAQPLDPDIDEQTAETVLKTRLAFIETGDPAMDKLSKQALAGLSRELYRRTALEPGPPVSVNPETDDLSVYPFLYWPIIPGMASPSEAALANIENFMRFGGLILFDTRDDERAVGAGSTPEARALQGILSQMNIPPLAPVELDHVLMRSFYLLPDLQGRLRNNPVWVASETSGANDGVTPVIIGGRDWAGAWATDSIGRPVRPIGRGGARTRELAYRTGINMVMVAFTGNYKSDQVHTPVLLERLGK
ncbi:MAG: LytTR family transcriptional regulator [Hyphococcus sp.]|nr:MAG: LytTR family transcriptional regulator [Marinicaulis sp.]